ncbi:MAG TPA: response regulator [Ignavibacteriales bacterium]|nr:response regulator [Ignavibacteriales bacterium]
MNILYIEDNEGDKLLVRTIIKSINPAYNVFIFPDGPSALGFLNMMKSKESSSIDIILLDFGLPRMNGIDILQVLQSDESFSSIPVVGFSGSGPMREEFKTMGAVAFIEKKVDLYEMELELRDVLSAIKSRYL